MPQSRVQDGAPRRLVRQLVPFAVLLVVVGAIVGVAALRTRADRGRADELTLTRLEAVAQREYAQLGGAVAAETITEDMLADVRQSRVEFDAVLAAVDMSAKQDIANGAAAFRYAANAVYRMLSNGQSSLAADRVRAEAGPAVMHLLDEVAALSAKQADDARRLEEVSDIGSLLLLFVAGIIVWQLLRKADRARSVADRAAAEALNQQRFRALVQNSSDVITVIDSSSRVLFQTPSVEAVFGYKAADMVGSDITEIVHPDDLDRVTETFLRVLEEGATFSRHECRVRHADGSYRYVETTVAAQLDDPLVAGWILNTRDITERKQLEDQLTHQAFHDSLTGLANRALFRNRIEHALNRQRRHRDPLAILLFDLDGFKTINDSLGHAFGDKMLAAVAERLGGLLRPSDTACRLGGDEFAVLVEDLAESCDVTIVADRLLAGLRTPFVIDGKEVVTDASVGVALADLMVEGSDTPDDLLRNADVAMYTAKSRGRGRYELFKPSMHKAMLDRLDLEADLRRAVDRDEFVLHYQPTVSLRDGRISGMEALVRWNSPERGMVPPGVFIPVTEDTGLIVPLGVWVLEEACRQAVAWRHEFGVDAPRTISVNVSARQLVDEGLVEEFASVLARTGVNPNNVILEITESAIMADAEAMTARLHELKSLGVRLAIDDFGTGYSSMSYLCSFPIDILKIDRSFVSGVGAAGGEPQKLGIVRTIVELGHILDLETVAEGIELDEELEQLRALDCDLGQGYRFARPLSADAVVELLSSQAAARRRGEIAVLPNNTQAESVAS